MIPLLLLVITSVSSSPPSPCSLANDHSPPTAQVGRNYNVRVTALTGKGYWESKRGGPWRHHGRFSSWWIDGEEDGVAFVSRKACEEYVERPKKGTGFAEGGGQ